MVKASFNKSSLIKDILNSALQNMSLVANESKPYYFLSLVSPHHSIHQFCMLNTITPILLRTHFITTQHSQRIINYCYLHLIKIMENYAAGMIRLIVYLASKCYIYPTSNVTNLTLLLPTCLQCHLVNWYIIMVIALVIVDPGQGAQYRVLGW